MAGTDESRGATKEGLSHLNLMDKAWDSQWVMRFVCIVLFVDAALVLKSGAGLLQWSTRTAELWQDLGTLVVAATTFGLLVSFVLPLLGNFVRWLIFLIPGIGVTDERGGGFGYVASGVFRDYALKRESEFLLRMYDDAWQRVLRHRAHLDKIGSLVFATTLMAVTDLALAFKHRDGRSLVLDVVLQLGDAGVVSILFLLAAAGWMLHKTWFAPWPSTYVYYPPLYLELRAEKQQLKSEEVRELALRSRK